MTRRRQRIVLTLAALGLLVSGWLMFTGERPPASSPPAERSKGAGARSNERATGTAAPARLHTFKKGARTAVPKLAAVLPPAFDAGSTRHPRRLDRGGDGPTDKRPGPRRPDTEVMKKALFQRLDQALEAAQSCLDAWSEQDDSLDAGVMLAFGLDERGLQQVWIHDREGVPAGPLACIANSVYPMDWSGLTKEPVEVTVPIKYEPRDAG